MITQADTFGPCLLGIFIAKKIPVGYLLTI